MDPNKESTLNLDQSGLTAPLKNGLDLLYPMMYGAESNHAPCGRGKQKTIRKSDKQGPSQRAFAEILTNLDFQHVK